MLIPWDALIGGMLLGVSALLLLLLNGKIAGISGILAGVLKLQQKDTFWRGLFIVGMVVSGYLFSNLGFSLPESYPMSQWWVVIIAGFLVGLGTNTGNGCTSGHGICGIGRLSIRSIVATIIFMATAVITVYLTH
ncbi:YeeE/YedE family protein [Photobacterium damselae]|uniref:YeeE/YedE family protein n=1 Tax=Photobacterium damselae TaxID=38293 RepID=UPI001EE0EE5A|nr:YeeE/YedE family protein [Photobacterium damselae]